jgi:hypothetical protein
MNEGRTTVKALRKKYRKMRKKEKGRILDHLEEEHGYNRQYASRLLAGVVMKEGEGRERRGSKPHYGEVYGALKYLWQVYDYICSKRLAAVVEEALRKLKECGELDLDKGTEEKLAAMSPRTMDRLLAKDRKRMSLRSRARTRPGTLLKHMVPVKTHSEWNDTEPGFLQVDCVGHDGGNPRGEFNQTVDATDVATTWTETRAVRNKAQCRVFAALEQMASDFPFPIKGMHSDTGGEFISDQLFRYCNRKQISFTRGRVGKKNDNAYVEQKNWSVVRRAVGYGRHEGDEDLLNRLYRVLRLYTNFFMPTMKCVARTRHGSRTTRHYDTPKTPYQRVLDSPGIAAKDKACLRAIYARLNPVALKKEITRLQGILIRRAAKHGTPILLQEVA